MAVEFIKECLNGCVGIEGGHIHAPEIRTFDTADECIDVITAKYVRAAIDAEAGGVVVVFRRDDGRFGCHFISTGEVIDHAIADDEPGVREWLTQWHPRIHQTAVEGNGTVN